MEHYNSGACAMASKAKHVRTPEEQISTGKVKSSSDFCGTLTDSSIGFQEGHESDSKINISEHTRSPGTITKCRDQFCSTDFSKENMNNYRQLPSSVSASTNLVHKKGNCSDGTSGLNSWCSGLASNENLKERNAPKEISQGIDSVQNISSKSAVSSENGEVFQKQNIKLADGRMDGCWPDTSEEKLKQSNIPDKHLKTESSSSNSTHVFLPSYSNESCQETSVDAKSCKHSSTGMATSTCTDFKCSMEEPPVKGSVLDMTTQNSSKDVLDGNVFSPGKLTVSQASEDVNHVIAGDCGEIQGITAEIRSMAAEETDIPKSSLPNKKCALFPKQDKEEPCYELDDALEVATRVAKEVEQEVGRYKDVSRSPYYVEERNDETNFPNSVNSIYLSTNDSLTKTICRIPLCDEQGNCSSFCSTKTMVDSEVTTRNEVFSENGKLQGVMGSKLVDETTKGCHRQELSNITSGLGDLPGQMSELKDLVAKDEISHSKFDLNEEIMADVELPAQLVNPTLPNHAENVSRPVPVVAKSGIPICLPMSWLQTEGVSIGWRGSAATSAFRPTSNSKSCYRNNASLTKDDTEKPNPSNVKGIDLNIAAAGADFDMEVQSSRSGFHSEESVLEISPSRQERLYIDLNSVGENEDNCGPSCAPAALKQTVKDFDLNDNPASADFCTYSHTMARENIPSLGRTSTDPAVSVMRKASSGSSHSGPAYFPNVGYWQGFSYDHVKPYMMAASSILSPAEQMQRVAPTHHKMPCTSQPPPFAFHYSNGFCIDPSKSSAIYSPGALPYITDARRPASIPQYLSSGPLAAFSRGPPSIMGAAVGPGPNDIAVVRPNFDLNNGLTAMESGSREGYVRQFIPSNTMMAEQLKSVDQPGSFATTMKRGEPDGGWDSHQLRYRQFTSLH